MRQRETLAVLREPSSALALLIRKGDEQGARIDNVLLGVLDRSELADSARLVEHVHDGRGEDGAFMPPLEASPILFCDGLSKKRTCGHQAHKKGETTAGQLAGNDQSDTKNVVSKPSPS